MLDEFDNKEDITLYEKKAITDFFERNGLKLERVDGRIAVVLDDDLRYLEVLDTYEGAKGWLRGVHFALEGRIEEKDKKLRLTKSEIQSAIDFVKGNTTKTSSQKSLADQLKYERQLLRNVLQMSSSEKTYCKDRLIRELNARDSGNGEASRDDQIVLSLESDTINWKTPKVAPLNKIKANDIPRGLDPEDVATD